MNSIILYLYKISLTSELCVVICLISKKPYPKRILSVLLFPRKELILFITFSSLPKSNSPCCV